MDDAPAPAERLAAAALPGISAPTAAAAGTASARGAPSAWGTSPTRRAPSTRGATPARRAARTRCAARAQPAAPAGRHAADPSLTPVAPTTVGIPPAQPRQIPCPEPLARSLLSPSSMLRDELAALPDDALDEVQGGARRPPPDAAGQSKMFEQMGLRMVNAMAKQHEHRRPRRIRPAGMAAMGPGMGPMGPQQLRRA